jgi:hypothetical protein
MTIKLPVVTKRWVAALVFGALVLQGFATPLHAVTGLYGHDLPVSHVMVHDAGDFAPGAENSALIADQHVPSCCSFSGVCHSTPALISCSTPLQDSRAVERPRPALAAYASHSADSPEHPPRPF